jgi:hypothetical protein
MECKYQAVQLCARVIDERMERVSREQENRLDQLSFPVENVEQSVRVIQVFDGSDFSTYSRIQVSELFRLALIAIS